MKYPTLTIVLVLFFIGFIQSVGIGYIYSAGRDYGEFSSKITAEPELKDISTQYYVCGLGFLQTSWVTSLWECYCGKRWYRGKRSWRCNWCDKQFWTQVSSIRVKYCHKDAWENQKTQNFSTGKTPTQNWRQFTCPKGQYATGISVRLGFQTSNNVDVGMDGAQLRCENIKFTQKSLVQDNYGHALTEMSKNPKNTFLTGFQFKYVKNGIIVGLKAYFDQSIKPSSASIEYGKVELDGNTTIKTIEQLVKQNRDSVSIPYTIELRNNYTMTQSWTNDVELMNNIELVEGVKANPPTINGTKVLDNGYYTVKTSPFKFKASQTITFTPTKTVPTLIPSCYVHKTISVVQQQKARATYTMSLTYVSPTTNEKMTKTITGVWTGVVYAPIKTNISSTLIEGCKDE